MALLGKQPLIVGMSVALLVLSTLSAALRFFSRHQMHVGFWWDDWCSLVAMTVSYSLNIIQFVSIKCGLGIHTRDAPNDGPKCLLKSLYAVEIFYAFCMPLIKMTVVLLYWRIFNTKRLIRYASFLITGMLVAWNIGALFSGIFQCTPIPRYWNKEIRGHCVNGLVYFRSIASLNLLTDVLVLALPLPILWRLNKPLGERIALSAIFSVGAFVSIISIVRIVILVSPVDPDPMWDSTDGTIWTAVETSVGVICVNLPVMGPLARRYIPFCGWTKSRTDKSYSTLSSRSKPIRLRPQSSWESVHSLGGSMPSTTEDLTDNIRVTTHFRVETEDRQRDGYELKGLTSMTAAVPYR